MSLITSPTCTEVPPAGAASGLRWRTSDLRPHWIHSGTASGLRRWRQVHSGMISYLRRRCQASVGRSIRHWSTTEPTSLWQAPGIDILVSDSGWAYSISVGSINFSCYPCPVQFLLHHLDRMHLINYLCLCCICYRTNRRHSHLLHHFWIRPCVIL